MSDDQAIYSAWSQNPNGLIPPGAFCETCGRFNVRCTTVTVIALNETQNILMVKRGKNPEQGSWALPGGYLDWHETLMQAAERELLEETGLTAEKLVLTGVYDALHRDKDGRENIDHCYVTQVRGAPIKQTSEIDEIAWFAYDQLPSYIAFDHRTMLDDYFSSVKSDQQK